MSLYLNIEVFQGVSNFFFLFLNNAWKIEKFSQDKHFFFYCVYVFKMAIWLILNKQASKIWCWAILAINVCVMCLCVCPSLLRLSEFHVRQGKIKLVQSAESPGLTAVWNPAQICPWSLSKCQAFERKQKGKVQAGSKTEMWHHFWTWHETETDIHELGFACPGQWEMGIGKGRKRCWFPFGRSKGPAEAWVWRNCFFGPWWWLPSLKDFSPFQEVKDAGQSCWKNCPCGRGSAMSGREQP